MTKNLSIKLNIHSYLVGIGKNVWFKIIADNKKHSTVEIDMKENIFIEAEEPEQLYLLGEKKEQLHAVLENIGKNCKEVLMLWSLNYKMAEIAQALHYKSEQMARKKKCICLKELLLYLEANPHIANELKI